MKKNKLILLTIMMVLVLYCGAVIFVTKPNSFAYNAIFGDDSGRVLTRSTQQSVAAETVDTDKILSQAEAVAKDVASQTGESIKKTIEDELPALVDEAVKKAIAEYGISEQIAKTVSDEVLKQQGAIESHIYDAYKDSIVDAVTQEVMERFEVVVQTTEDEPTVSVVAEPVAEEPVSQEAAPSALTVEEYQAQRQEIRKTEINDLLEKLGN